MKTKEQVETRFIEMINKYLKLKLVYPLDPNLSLFDLKYADPAVNREKEDPLDSIDLLELVIQIEEEFGVVIEDSEIKKLTQWSNLIDHITANQK